MDELFSKQALSAYFKIWERIKNGETLSGDSGIIAEVMEAHPEFDPYWPEGESAFRPQEIDGSVVNPLVHTGVHVAVERQIAHQDPEEVEAALKTLLKKGLSRHEAIHRIASLWGGLYFRSIRQQGGSMEEGVYLEELRALAEE
ncbi:MAG: DUF1841 family protein [Candidatus Manganitrophaceae bacterium]